MIIIAAVIAALLCGGALIYLPAAIRLGEMRYWAREAGFIAYSSAWVLGGAAVLALVG